MNDSHGDLVGATEKGAAVDESSSGARQENGTCESP